MISITFDCYGTLIDWDKGIRAFFKELLPDKDDRFLQKIIKHWEAIQFQLIQEKYIPYDQLQNASFIQTLREFNIPLVGNPGKRLMNKIPTWQPFADVYPVLSKLKNNFKLSLISNGSLSILNKSAKKMRIKFDKILSAELIHSYKPDTNFFQCALKKLNRPVSEIIHVAAGYSYDIIPAKKIGLKTVWVNRSKVMLPGKILPDYEIPTLNHLIDIISEKEQ